MPTLPQNLITLFCYTNKLTGMPTLPQNLIRLYFENNPIFEIVNHTSLIEINRDIRTLNNFRHMYRSLKFKKKFRKWLLKSKELQIRQRCHPSKVIKLLEEGVDIDDLASYLENG